MESLKGKLTEEEARKLLSIHSIEVTPQEPLDILIEKHIDKTIEMWKKSNIIKQNPVEKAEKEYREWDNSSFGFEPAQRAEGILISSLHDAINYLKKQLEESK